MTTARIALIAVFIALAFPGAASAATQTLGSPLTATPNVNLGCDQRLDYLADPNLNSYLPVPSNQPDCTYRQSGVFGVLTDPRGSTAPGTGRITSVAVRSGPTPGLVRFVVLRQLSAAGSGGNEGGTYCCYFVAETAPVRPAANAVSTFAVDLPVQRSVDANGVITNDHVAISGVSGTGSLPLAAVGPITVNAFYLTGAVNVADYFPRMGALPNDFGAGRRENGLPNLEILMRWTWCGTVGTGAAHLAQAGCAPAGTGPGVTGPGGASPAATAGADVLRGSARADRICGLGGSDTIRGLGGNDTLFGDQCARVAALPAAFAAARDDGNDRLSGGTGNDRLSGGGGNDTSDRRRGQRHALRRRRHEPLHRGYRRRQGERPQRPARDGRLRPRTRQRDARRTRRRQGLRTGGTEVACDTAHTPPAPASGGRA